MYYRWNNQEEEVVPPFSAYKVQLLNAVQQCAYEIVSFTVLYISIVKFTLCCGYNIFV